jgi:hypothetical protein
MVFVGNRRTEQRENAVTGGLHDVSVVSMDRFNHQLQGRIYDCPRLFGIEAFHHLGRALDIGEERGYRLAFAFDNGGICRFGYDRNLPLLNGDRGDWAVAIPVTSTAPQSPQKRLLDGLSAPHFGQRFANDAPQSPQNFLPAGLSLPHFEQRIYSPVVRSLCEFSSPAVPQSLTVQWFTKS